MLPDYTDADFAEAMLRLLPRGPVWPRDAGSVWRALMKALAPTYTRSYAAAKNLLAETFPPAAIQLLPDWEATLGLPDACAGLSPTVQQRQNQVRARLAATGGQSVPYFVGVAADLGYPVTITECAPSRFGRPFGRPFGGTAWAHVWQVNAPTYQVQRFRFGTDRFGEPFATWGNTVLQCELYRLAPAQTQIIFRYG